MSHTSFESTTIAQLLTEHQNRLGASDAVIANALGFERPNAVALIKSGAMRLPVTRVKPFAMAFDLNASDVLRTLLRETDPALLEGIEACMGPLVLTPGEQRLIQRLRHGAQGREDTPVLFERDAIVALVLA